MTGKRMYHGVRPFEKYTMVHFNYNCTGDDDIMAGVVC